jgi:glycosyltransferase involved in cell wall biosynthesis
VQTQLEKERMKARFNKLPKIELMPPKLPYSFLGEPLQAKPLDIYNKSDSYIRIACLSHYFDHKNIELLYKAANYCAEKDLPFQFLLTVESKQGRKARKLITRIEKNNCSDHIVNVGKIRRRKIKEFVYQIDALVLPSLIESFSLNLVEAWHFQKPLFISDRPFARRVCNDAAIYFSPNDPKDLVIQIDKLFSQPKEKNKLLEKGQNQLRNLPDEERIMRILFNENEEII